MEKGEILADYSSGPMRALLRIVQPFLALLAGIASATNGHSQTLNWSSPGEKRLLQSRLEGLEAQQSRRDLPCVVTTPKPELGFDFMFHTGYQVEVPVRELAGDGNELTIQFRVVPQDRPDDPSYMVQRVSVPALAAHSRGEGRLHGIFTLGEGKYHVDWLMRDQRERVCAVSWDLEAKLKSKDSQLRQWIPQALVQLIKPLFEAEASVIRVRQDGSPHFSIIVNVDLSDPSAALSDDRGLYGLLAILRRMERDPPIELRSIIVCSLETEQVIYQQENKGVIDLTALGGALASVKLGTVDAKRLVSTRGPAQFAADLIREQLGKENTDALIVLGPKEGSETRVSRQVLESLDKLGKQAFYLRYDTGKPLSPWRDPISSVMKRLCGFEYDIHRPKDFFNAWSDVVARMERARAPSAPIATTGAAQGL
jgi:hypothetical protein